MLRGGHRSLRLHYHGQRRDLVVVGLDDGEVLQLHAHVPGPRENDVQVDVSDGGLRAAREVAAVRELVRGQVCQLVADNAELSCARLGREGGVEQGTIRRVDLYVGARGVVRAVCGQRARRNVANALRHRHRSD